MEQQGSLSLIPFGNISKGKDVVYRCEDGKFVICKISEIDRRKNFPYSLKYKSNIFHAQKHEIYGIFITFLAKTCHKQRGCECWESERNKCSSYRDTPINKRIDLNEWQRIIDDNLLFKVVNINDFNLAKI